MDIYANEKTWQIMDSKNMLGKIDNSQKHVFSRDKLLTFGDLDIESFGVSHDAIDPCVHALLRLHPNHSDHDQSQLANL